MIQDIKSENGGYIYHAPVHHTWCDHCIWYLCHTFGSFTILSCIVTGAVVLLIIIFRKWVKDKLGDGIEFLDRLINGKK